jgi:hypothetical protein
MMRRSAAAVGFGIALAVVAGCSSDKTAQLVGEMNKSNIQRVANLYAAFQNGKSNGGPQDEKEFKDFVNAYAPDKLKMMGVDTSNIESVFKSERDGQPFKIRYKVGGGRGAVAPVAFEVNGKDGKKQVGFTGGKVEDCDEARYKDLLAGKDTTPPAAGPAGGGTVPGGGSRPGGGRPAGAPTGPPG